MNGIDRINWRKKDGIKNLIQFTDEINKIRPTIDKIIIFGSAIRDDCRIKSDIDICLFTEYKTNDELFFKYYSNIENVTNSLCDIWVYKRLKDTHNIKNVIDSEGVVVYEYKPN